MFEKLQNEHRVWATANFGEQDIKDYELGLIEEVGELAHSVLKRKQNIRNNENHNAKIRDAVADIVIYLAGYCNCRNIDMSKHCHDTKKADVVGDVTRLNLFIGELVVFGNEDDIGLVFQSLWNFCRNEKIHFINIVYRTWNDEVKLRNWKENPNCEQK